MSEYWGGLKSASQHHRKWERMSFTFREYGLTDHAGVHRLRGPGLDEKIGEGGVSAMGGKWPVMIDDR